MALNIIDGGDTVVEHLLSVITGRENGGKTSLALTSNKPVLLDFDDGHHRAGNRQGKAVVRCKSWADVDDMTAADFKPYKTAVVDTVGTAIDSMASDIIRRESKYSMAGGALSIQGYGVLKSRFRRWLDDLQALGMDVILVAHLDEEKRGDQIVSRLLASGSSKQEIYRRADLMGRIFIKGDKRILSFNPTEVDHGKNCGLPDRFVPVPGKEPEFFANVLKEAVILLNDNQDSMDKEQRRLEDLRKHLDGLKSGADLNRLLDKMVEQKAIPVDKHMLMDRAKVLEIKYDRETRKFEEKEQVEEPRSDEQPPHPAEPPF